MKTLTQKIGDIGTARRKRVDARAAALIAEEISHDLTWLDLERQNLPFRSCSNKGQIASACVSASVRAR